MAKVNGPLLSFAASGSIANVQTYSRWRGIPYVRQKVTPSNPNTSEQQETRSVFAWLMGLFRLLSSDAQQPWVIATQGQPLTDRNKIAQTNISLLRGQADISDFIASPGARGGLPVLSAAATPGSGTITVAVGAPALPSGWSIVKAVGLAIKQQDPATDKEFNSVTVTDNTSTYSLAFTGLAATDWLWSVWFIYMKPDGSLAAGPSTSGVATVT